MRYIRYLFLGLLAVALIAVALANRDIVTLRLLPEALAQLVGVERSVRLPLFLVIFAGILGGLAIGFVWEWAREMRIRGEAQRRAREVRKLEREVDRLKGEKYEGQDDVLALLDDTGKRSA